MAARTPYHGADEFLPSELDLPQLRAAAMTCHGCDLWQPATQTVFGEGPTTARLMLVGEQPGDVEDTEGRPFVGPAGKVLAGALRDAGLADVPRYTTNAVKHFRFTPTPKRRIHQTPGPEHIRACRPWLDAEFEVLQPEVVVCLGATAAKALISPSFRITKDRGQLIPWSPPGADADGFGIPAATPSPFPFPRPRRPRRGLGTRRPIGR